MRWGHVIGFVLSVRKPGQPLNICMPTCTRTLISLHERREAHAGAPALAARQKGRELLDMPPRRLSPQQKENAVLRLNDPVMYFVSQASPGERQLQSQ
jgi:hypothetical protein